MSLVVGVNQQTVTTQSLSMMQDEMGTWGSGLLPIGVDHGDTLAGWGKLLQQGSPHGDPFGRGDRTATGQTHLRERDRRIDFARMGGEIAQGHANRTPPMDAGEDVLNLVQGGLTQRSCGWLLHIDDVSSTLQCGLRFLAVSNADQQARRVGSRNRLANMEFAGGHARSPKERLI